jgi:hypothetical protein
MPPPGTETFLVFPPLYGPLAIWPALEFWLPRSRCSVALSLGTGLVLGTIAALMGLTWSTMLFTLRLQRQRSRTQNVKMGGLGGLGAAGASFCCCCAPALYPVLALVFGSIAAPSVSTWLLGSSSPFYNLSMIGMIAMILWALASVCRRTTLIEATATTCEIPVGATSTSAGMARVARGRTAAVEQGAL